MDMQRNGALRRRNGQIERQERTAETLEGQKFTESRQENGLGRDNDTVAPSRLLRIATRGSEFREEGLLAPTLFDFGTAE